MLDFRRVVKNRKIQPEAAFCPTKNQGLEWMNSNPRMQIAKMSKLKPSEYVSFLSRLRTQALEKPTKEALSEYIFAERVLIESTEYFDNSDELKKYYKPKPDDIHKAKVRLLRKADSTKTVIDYNYMHFLYISMQTGEGSSRENALEYLAAKEIVTKDWRERNQRRKQSAL